MGIFDDEKNELFATYAVAFNFQEKVEKPSGEVEYLPTKIMGGIPKDPKTIEGWWKAKAGVEEHKELVWLTFRTLQETGADIDVTEDDLRDKSPEELMKIMDQAVEEVAAEKSTNGFKRDKNGLYIEDRQVKAMLKESTNIVFPYQKGKPEGQWGITKKTPRSYVAETVFVRPSRIYLGRDEPDGIELVVGHVPGPKGKKSTLTYHEYVAKPEIAFAIEVLRDGLTWKQWKQVLLHAQFNGLGALRSQSHGRFDTMKFERVA